LRLLKPPENKILEINIFALDKCENLRMETFKFDPKMFISPPYIRCPKCGKESFGILIISDHHYCRRCKECLFPHGDELPASFPLPKLSKKIIYVDQFAISNMMKALNPQTKSYQKGTLDEFWIGLFKRLHSLCKLHLIICPDSGFHTNESLLSTYYEPLKRMYELLSHGVSFYDHETIKRFQISQHSKYWISGEAEKELNLNIDSVVHGEINAWQDRFIITANINYGLDWIEDLRRTREQTNAGLSKIFFRWQSEKDKTFDDWFAEESMAFGRVTLQIYLNYLKKFSEISMGHFEMGVNDIFFPPAVILIHEIKRNFREAGVSDSDIWQKAIEYLTSPSLRNVPFIKIASMLWAALARKASAGRKQPPNQGMANDIEVISVLLPYCDAMFMDNECHAYLKEKPLCDVIDYGTKIFCQNTKDDFLNYLDDIERNAPQEHLDKVDEVYGKAWKEPYTTIYKTE
jgi:hypothetical protein